MIARITHLSRFLMKGTVDRPSAISLDRGPPQTLNSYPSLTGGDRTFYLFKPDGFSSGTEVSIKSADIGPIAGEACHFQINLIPASETDWRRQLCIGLNCAPDWAVDDVTAADGKVSFFGWVMQQVGESFQILVNGRAATVRFVDREDVDHSFAHLAPHRRWSGFLAESNIDPQSEDVIFRLANGPAMTYAYPLTANRSFPLPDPERIFRVNATLSESEFNRLAYTTYKNIATACRRLYPQLTRPINILDWGCGCGGLARFMLQDSDFKYLGCDIDPDNVAWCNNNLEPGRFIQVPLEPPARSPLPQRLDVIVGISVISHLHPKDIKRWLNWLSGHLADDGHLIVSTLSIQAISRLPPDLAYTFCSDGYSFNTATSELGKMIEDQEYYGTSYQTPAFLAGLIEPALEISHHIPSALSQQDLFIIKRPARAGPL